LSPPLAGWLIARWSGNYITKIMALRGIFAVYLDIFLGEVAAPGSFNIKASSKQF